MPALIALLCAYQASNGVHAAPAPTAPPSAAPCSKAVASASETNAMALFQGAVACGQEGRKDDTNFLMILGQIRAVADMAIFAPLDEENSEKVGQLYAQLFYRFGGLGFPEVYRSPENVTALEKRLRDANLQLTKAYDPGWSYRASSKTDVYAQVLSNALEHRLWQMRNMALKLQNDEYYEASRAHDELQRRNPVFREGTPAYEESIRLTRRMEEAAKDIPELPEPQDTLPYARLNEQDPELARRQVAVGFNGPASMGTYIFRSAAEVRRSWLARALPEQQLGKLVSNTDFSKQVLIAYSVGERMNASAQVMLSELKYSERFRSYSIATRLGVVPETCGVRFAKSYPFVVGVIEAVPGAEVGSSGTSNFPAECGPVLSGRPTTGP